MHVALTCAKTKFLKTDKDHLSPIMMIGDENGFVSKWDLSEVIAYVKSLGFKPVQSVSKYLVSFNPKKNAQVNAYSSAETLMFFA